jgi:cytoskeleton protein RodZ
LQKSDQPTVPASSGASDEAAQPATPPPAQSAPEVTLDLSLHADSWVEVYDASGERLYYDLGHAGSTVHVRGAAPLRVFLGDSPAVDVTVDGKPFDQSRFQHSDNTARFEIAAPASDAAGN